MKSTITKLYDYKQAVIPAELLNWHVPDEEIAAQLETLSHNHAYEMEPETVQTGDSVACRGESAAARWNRETLLLFPGRGLCDSALENACLGARVGECRTVSTDEGEVTLTVKRILRRAAMPVGDQLVKAEGIDGVNTVAEYYDWYREQNEPERRRSAAMGIAGNLLYEIRMQSELSIDQEEKDAFVWDCANSYCQSLVKAGIDPTVPSEGTDFLTEEQAKQKMYVEHEPFFTMYVADAYFVQKETGADVDAICKEELNKLAADNGLEAESLLTEDGWAILCGQVLHNKALELMANYTEQFLED